jgi:predicted alpha/beta-fold hydrolase
MVVMLRFYCLDSNGGHVTFLLSVTVTVVMLRFYCLESNGGHVTFLLS